MSVGAFSAEECETNNDEAVFGAESATSSQGRIGITGVRNIHTIEVYRNRLKKDSVRLEYVEEPLRKAQARFHGRTVFTPIIDLSTYRWAAVVDWIDIEFELSRATQYWHLNDRIKHLTGRKEYPEALDKGPGNTATKYRLRVQEPDFKELRMVLEDIDATHEFATPPQIVGLEVSIDAYPLIPDEASRARLHGALIRHFFPTTSVLSDKMKWPRFMPGLVQSTDYTVGRNVSNNRQDIISRMTPAYDRSPLYDSSYYVGSKDDPQVSWRIQNKILDKQNKATGSRVILAEQEKRVRIEVTLGPDGCYEVGLAAFRDIGSFSFTTMQKRFFQFMKPTFGVFPLGAARRSSSAIRTRVEDTRKQRFLNAGVLGLQIREDATRNLRALELANMMSWHKARGSKMPRNRRGAGPYGTMIAHEEMARVVGNALASLQRKVEKEMR